MKRWSVVSILAMLSLLAFGAGSALGQEQSSGRGKSPEGDWKISFAPYTGAGYETAPMRVVAVKGEILPDGRIRIRWPHLRRNTARPFQVVKLTAYVYDENHPDSVLFRGEIAGLRFDARNWPPQDTDLERSVEDTRMRATDNLTEISYKPLLSALIKDGKLEGRYRIALGVSKVVFDDGTVWRQQDEPAVTKNNK